MLITYAYISLKTLSLCVIGSQCPAPGISVILTLVPLDISLSRILTFSFTAASTSPNTKCMGVVTTFLQAELSSELTSIFAYHAIG